MASDAKVIILRHGKAGKVWFPDADHPDGGEFRSPATGSYEDTHLRHLTPEGAAEIEEIGERLLGDGTYGAVQGVSSRAVRTQETILHALLGYDRSRPSDDPLSDRVKITKVPGIGLDGKNWDLGEGVPPYTNTEPGANDYVRAKLTEMYFPTGQGHPCMAEHGFYWFNALENGINRLREARRTKDTGLLVLSGHGGGSIDIIAAEMTGCLHIDRDRRQVEINDDAYPGFVEIGNSHFVGEIEGIRELNPTLSLALTTNGEVVAQKEISLLGINNIAQRFYHDAIGAR